ncbi:MAG: regulatory protein RecX [bacterium]|nr:MAG: regulatory protein RecX [bacterium]
MRRGRPERFIVTLDDEQEIILTPEIVLKYGIAPQREYSTETFLDILEEDALRQAKDQAMRYLSRRPHSRFELIRKMREKGFRMVIIQKALDELEKIDLVNDRDFARAFILNELRLRPVSRYLLTQKLNQRGIQKELYELLLDELQTEEQELELARMLADKFLKSHSREKGQKLREKLLRFLQTKGFNWEQIRQIVPSLDNDG